MPTVEEIKTRLRASNPVLNKMVNSETIQLTPEEYEETINHWAEVQYEQQEEQLIQENGGVTPNYAEYRRDAYGSIGDQLDMQYHDSVNGTTVWQDHIAAVKAKYPKP